MAVCPYLASIFGMPIWHPRNEAQVDELLKAGVEVYVTPLLVLAMTCLRAMMQSFPGARTLMMRKKVTTLYLFNEKMLHLVDDIFWHLGFKSAEHAEKVASQITSINIA
jgi:hypothetical protein